MNSKIPQRQRGGSTILLVEEGTRGRNERAIILGTYGYQVETVHGAAEGHLRWNASRPDLVLLALDTCSDAARKLWAVIKQAAPQQRMAFLNSDSLYLCPVYYDGKMVRQAEGAGDFLGAIRMLLAGPAPALASGGGHE